MLEAGTFGLDLARCRLVDLSYAVVPPGTEERPFITTRGLLADASFKHDVQTHTHVGTHVEAPAHFLQHGKTVLDMPLEQFMGRAVLLRVDHAADGIPLDAAQCQRLLGDVIAPEGDIVICHNADAATHLQGPESWPSLCADAAEWMVAHGVKLVGIDNYFRLGRDIPETRQVHDVLMSRDVCLVEFLDNLSALTKRTFYFMALPYKVASDSGWARAVAFEQL